MGAGRTGGDTAARLGLRLHPGPPDRARLWRAAVAEGCGDGAAGGGLNRASKSPRGAAEILDRQDQRIGRLQHRQMPRAWQFMHVAILSAGGAIFLSTPGRKGSPITLIIAPTSASIGD